MIHKLGAKILMYEKAVQKCTSLNIEYLLKIAKATFVTNTSLISLTTPVLK